MKVIHDAANEIIPSLASHIQGLISSPARDDINHYAIAFPSKNKDATARYAGGVK